jgi:uncharacterized HAD superfamily protein
VPPTVGLDLDGVVSDFVSAALLFWKRSGTIPESLRHDDWVTWDPQLCLPVSEDDFQAALASAWVWERVQLYPDAVEPLSRLLACAEVHVVTSRRVEADTQSWLATRGIQPSVLAHVSLRDKPRYAALHRLDAFFEDHLETAIGLASAVRRSYLVERPWNSPGDMAMPANLARCSFGWAVANYLADVPCGGDDDLNGCEQRGWAGAA